MPLNINIVQILLHMLNFVILAGVLTLVLYKPIVKFLSERRKKIEEEIMREKELIKENEILKAEYEKKIADSEKEAAELKKNIEKEAADLVSETINKAKEKAAEIISSAEAEAYDRKAHILDSAQTEIAELIISATEKLLGDSVSPERASALYDAFIKTLNDGK